MKIAKLLCLIVALVICAFLPLSAVMGQGGTVNLSQMPNSGTYFVVSSSNGEALQPNGPTAGQNVFLTAYNKSGLQKWRFTRLIDPKTKKPTNRYQIRLAGEAQDVHFQPHPSVSSRTAIISSGTTNFVLEPGADGFLIKSVKLNGDAMFVYPVTDSTTEVHFGPNDGSTKFRWQIEPAG